MDNTLLFLFIEKLRTRQLVINIIWSFIPTYSYDNKAIIARAIKWCDNYDRKDVYYYRVPEFFRNVVVLRANYLEKIIEMKGTRRYQKHSLDKHTKNGILELINIEDRYKQWRNRREKARYFRGEAYKYWCGHCDHVYTKDYCRRCQRNIPEI